MDYFISLLTQRALMWIIYAICSGLSAAALAIIINLGLRHADALIMTTLFCVIMTLILFVACLITKRFDYFSLGNLTSKEWIALILAGAAAAAGYLTYFLALKNGPICLVAAIDRFSIIYIVIASYFILNVKVNLMAISGSLLIVLGTYFISCI